MKEKVKYITSLTLVTLLVTSIISISTYACVASANGEELVKSVDYTYEVQ